MSRGSERGGRSASSRCEKRVEPAVDLFEAGVLAADHAENSHDHEGRAERVGEGYDVTFGVYAVNDVRRCGEVGGELGDSD